MSTPVQSRGGTVVAIVLNYRTPEATVRAVQSILESGRELAAIVVVDNGSDDGSADRLREALPYATIVESPRNLGFSGGCNLAMAESKELAPDLLLLFNSDAVLEPHAIQRMEETLLGDARYGIVAPVLLSMTEPARISSAGIAFSSLTGRMRHHGVGELYDPSRVKAPQVVDAVSGCAMLVRREVFERIGKLDESYFFSFEDVDFCLRALRAGFLSVVDARATVRHVGSLSIGERSARKLYFSTRNHLRAAARSEDARFPGHRSLRAASIVALSLAFALRSGGAPRLEGVGAVLRGTWDHIRGRYDDGS